MKAFWREIREHMEQKNPECLLIAEWGSPTDAVNAGFHLDFLLHSHNSAYTSLFRHEKGRNTTRLWVGKSYFSKDGKGDINEYLDRYLYDLKNVKEKNLLHYFLNHQQEPVLALRLL